MLQMMHLVFPEVMQIQMDIIKNFGFPGNREGLIQFEQLIRDLEKDDPEISRLRSQIRAIYLPPINFDSAQDVLIWDAHGTEDWSENQNTYYDLIFIIWINILNNFIRRN